MYEPLKNCNCPNYRERGEHTTDCEYFESGTRVVKAYSKPGGWLDEKTAEELIAQLRAADPIIAKIKKEHEGEKQMWHGILECPLCGGELYVVRHTNGHTWGSCQGKGDCLSWME